MITRQDHLNTVIQCARIARDLGGMTVDGAIDRALESLEEDCRRIVGGVRSTMTAEQVDDYRELAGVVQDVRNDFVSPAIGSFRDYVRAGVSA